MYIALDKHNIIIHTYYYRCMYKNIFFYKKTNYKNINN